MFDAVLSPEIAPDLDDLLSETLLDQLEEAAALHEDTFEGLPEDQFDAD